jgi:hypothetical protein
MSRMSELDILVNEYLDAVAQRKAEDRITAAYASLVMACGGSDKMAKDIVAEYEENYRG